MLENSIRLDIFLHNKYPQKSRQAIIKLIKNASVKVNGEHQTKPGFKITDKDNVQIDLPDIKKTRKLKKLNIDIIYEDKDCIVIDKPKGILTHAKGEELEESTIASWLIDKTIGLNGNRAGIVHRLDRLTSGVMICAKNKVAMSWLQKQFSLRKVKKTYIAVCTGNFKENHALINMPIIRDSKNPKLFKTSPLGKAATTEYKVLKTKNNLNLVELKPITGRTNQIRVHLLKINTPILGDVMYGGVKADRLYLHAKELEITLPNKKRQRFNSPLPVEFSKIMK